MINDEKYILLAQKLASEGNVFHKMLQVLFQEIKQEKLIYNDHRHPMLIIEKILIHAFSINLYYARDIERWNWWSQAGDWTNEDIDQVFEPWISRYLESQSSQHDSNASS